MGAARGLGVYQQVRLDFREFGLEPNYLFLFARR